MKAAHLLGFTAALVAVEGLGLKRKKGRPSGNGAALMKWKRKNRKKLPHMRARS